MARCLRGRRRVALTLIMPRGTNARLLSMRFDLREYAKKVHFHISWFVDLNKINIDIATPS